LALQKYIDAGKLPLLQQMYKDLRPLRLRGSGLGAWGMANGYPLVNIQKAIEMAHL
jgi:hypothetical protein